ncbi:MAG: DMT family transporter [Bacteroidota bacterium]|nr:DMT family transporter [Bacteroidota bacterium]
MKTIYTYLIVILAMLFWGLTFVWSSIVFEYYSPITTIFLRLVISTAIMFVGLKVFNLIAPIRKEDYRLFLLSALFNPFLYFLGENYGIKYSSATISAVVIAAIPVFTPIIGYYFIREKLSKVNIMGMVVSFSGILLILVDDDFSLNVHPVGVFALSVAVVTAVGYAIVLKRLAENYNAFLIIAVQNLIGIIYFLPLFLFFDLHDFLNIPVTSELVVAMLELAVFGSSLAFVFYAIGTRELGVNKTNFFTNLIPVITAVFAFFVLEERFDFYKILGMVIVILGVILSQLKQKMKIVNMYRFFWKFRK